MKRLSSKSFFEHWLGGQAVAKGRRDVTNATSSGTKVQNKGNPDEEPASEDDGDVVHVEYRKRTWKPNSRVFGPGWM